MNNVVLFKVFMVDDQETWCQFLREDLEQSLGRGKSEVVGTGVEKAREVFAKNRDFDILVVGDCISNGQKEVAAEVLDLVRWLRKRFKGTMIADSSYDNRGEALMAAGCDCRTEVRSRLAEVVANLAEKKFRPPPIIRPPRAIATLSP